MHRCCCGGRKIGDMPRTTIAIAGGSGYIGKFVTSAFIKAAVDEGWIEELRVLTRSRSEVIDDFEKQGVKISVVDFSIIDTLTAALSGVDILICTIGIGPGTEESKDSLLLAIEEAGIKTYFPSEFGANHYTRMKANYTHSIFEAKMKHFKQAQAKGIRVVGIFCSTIMEKAFGSHFGLDKRSDIWKLVGTGKVPVALTAEKDVGQFTVAAAFIAAKFKESRKVPNILEVYSDIRTIKGYAKLFRKVYGRPTTLEVIPLKEALEVYASNQDFSYLQQILFEEGVNDFTGSKGNRLLNPYEYVWKCKTIEEYVQEIGLL